MKRTPIKRRSPKKAAADREYSKFRAWFLDGRCDVCNQNPAADIHHRRRRSQGGGLTNPMNCVRICQACHDWVHRNPEKAHDAGWLLRHGDDDWSVCG